MGYSKCAPGVLMCICICSLSSVAWPLNNTSSARTHEFQCHRATISRGYVSTHMHWDCCADCFFKLAKESICMGGGPLESAQLLGCDLVGCAGASHTDQGLQQHQHVDGDDCRVLESTQAISLLSAM
jgi:hypothetical protein